MWSKGQTEVVMLGVKTQAKYEAESNAAYENGGAYRDAWVNEVMVNGTWLDAVELLSPEIVNELNAQIRLEVFGQEPNYESLKWFKEAA